MKVIWKDIVFVDFDGTKYDYTGLYRISNVGDIYSCVSQKVLAKSPDKDGYPRAVLSKDGRKKTFKTHRLVALVFLGLPEDRDKFLINHKDENKANNNVSNLEWCTVSENNNYGTRQKRVHSKRRETMATTEWKKNNSGMNGYNSKKIVSINVYNYEVTNYYSLTKACQTLHLSNLSRLSNALKRKTVTNDCIWFSLEEYNTVSQDWGELKSFIKLKKENFLKHYHR